MLHLIQSWPRIKFEHFQAHFVMILLKSFEALKYFNKLAAAMLRSSWRSYLVRALTPMAMRAFELLASILAHSCSTLILFCFPIKKTIVERTCNESFVNCRSVLNINWIVLGIMVVRLKIDIFPDITFLF